MIQESLPGDVAWQKKLGREGSGSLLDVLCGPATENLDQWQGVLAIHKKVQISCARVALPRPELAACPASEFSNTAGPSLGPQHPIASMVPSPGLDLDERGHDARAGTLP